MSRLAHLPITEIHEPLDPDRDDLDLDKLHELIESIRAYGLIQPITVQPAPDGYEVIAGHRRLLACRHIGLSTIACQILDDPTAAQTRGVRAAENLMRSDLSPLEEGRLVGALMLMHDNDTGRVANAINRSRAWVEQRLALAQLPEDLREDLREARLPLGHVLALSSVADHRHRRHLADSVYRAGATLAVLKSWISEWELATANGDVEFMPATVTTSAQGEVLVMVRCATCGNMHPYSRTLMIRACAECAQQLLDLPASALPQPAAEV